MSPLYLSRTMHQPVVLVPAVILPTILFRLMAIDDDEQLN